MKVPGFLRPPQDAPFEIRPSAGKGLGAFATEEIKPASCILYEEPLVVICKPVYAITDVDVETALSSLIGVEKQQFLSLMFKENGSLASPYETFMRNKFDVREADKGFDSPPVGEGMYLLGSRFNHSCVPNAAVVGSQPRKSNYAHAVYATKPIAKGEEICFNYNPAFYYQTAEIRRNDERLDFIATAVPVTLTIHSTMSATCVVLSYAVFTIS